MTVNSSGDLQFIVYIEEEDEVIGSNKTSMYSNIMIVREGTRKRNDTGLSTFNYVDLAILIGASEQQDWGGLDIHVILLNSISVHVDIQ